MNPATKLHTEWKKDAFVATRNNGVRRSNGEYYKRYICRHKDRGTRWEDRGEFGTFSFVLLCPRARSVSIELFWSGEHEFSIVTSQSDCIAEDTRMCCNYIIKALVRILSRCDFPNLFRKIRALISRIYENYFIYKKKRDPWAANHYDSGRNSRLIRSVVQRSM